MITKNAVVRPMAVPATPVLAILALAMVVLVNQRTMPLALASRATAIKVATL